MKKPYIYITALGLILLASIYPASHANANLWQDLWSKFTSPWSAKIEMLNDSPLPDTDALDTEPLDEPADTTLYKPVLDYEEAVVGAVDKAAPAVVSIVITKDLPVIEQCPYDPFSNLPPEVKQFFNSSDGTFYRPCQTGTAEQEIGDGTGFIVSENGLIVTNRHVVSDTKADYTVLLSNGRKYPAEVLARDSVLDLAVLDISASGLPVLELGDSDSVKLGQTAIAIGNALGEFSNTVSVGVISGLSRTITASGDGTDPETIEGVFQTDAAINPGNSGGPLLNLKGEVIGINTAVAADAQNVGFAIPINQARRAINSVLTSGTIIRPYLGVRYTLLDSDTAAELNLPTASGARLVPGPNGEPAVMPDSPAAAAGLQAGDIILEFDDHTIGPNYSPLQALRASEVGQTVSLKVWRDGSPRTILVTLAKRG